MTARKFGSPGLYIQGPGELNHVKEHLASMGDSFLVIASPRRVKDLGAQLAESFGEGYKIVFAQFGGESSRKEIARLTQQAEKEACGCIIGMGGGKVIDTAKAVANQLGTPCVIIPTIAASDAATTRCACIYNEDGSEDGEDSFDKNPDIVLVDSQIIANAPVRFLLAGMGDAMAKIVCATTCYEGYRNNELGGQATELGYAIAKLSYELLLEHGQAAKYACEQHVVTKDLEKIIETNILLAGIGCEVNGGTTDHGFYTGFCELKNRKEVLLHGEYVTFSTLATLVLQGAPKAQMDEMYSFCAAVGLPVCLADVKLDYMDEADFETVAKCVVDLPPTKNHPFHVTVEEAIAAMKTANQIGKLYKEGKKLF